MLNKKAIAAFAAGATLLSGMAFAAPAFVSAPAFADQTQAKKRTLDDINNEIKDAQKVLDDANAKVEEAKKTAADSDAAKSAAFTADAQKAVKEDGTIADPTNYKLDGGKVVKQAQGTDEVVAAANKYLDAKKKADEDDTAAKNAPTKYKVAEALAKLNSLQEELKTRPETVSTGAKAEAAKIKGELPALKAKVDAAFPAYAAAYNAQDKAADAVEAAENAKTVFVAKTPKDQHLTKAFINELKKYDLEIAKAKNAQAAAARKLNATMTVFEAAVKAYNDKLAKYGEQVAKLTDADKVGVDTVADLALDMTVTYNPEYSTGAGNSGNGGSGEGGSGTSTKVDYKADVAFLNTVRKDAKSAAADVKAANEALAKFAKAKKANDKAAMKAALKEIHTLAEALRNKKHPKKSALEQLLDPESVTTTTPFGTNTLFTNYKGLYVELLAHGLTNVRAYNVLLDKLEYGLHNGGWENVIKNFPEHDLTVENTCGFLASLRAQLRKAVKHYEHVQAAVKDIQVELKADYEEAKAQHRWDDVKVIESKMAQAGALMGAANSNRTRAKALLNSADDHAAELRCDTQAKDVRAAMDKEPNSPFKKHGQKHDEGKKDGKSGKHYNGGAADGSHKLGKTGATVALVAVAASVLAGMGAALRKIRH